LELLKFKEGLAAIVVTATLDIHAGEELTFDYNYEDPANELLPCNCGLDVWRG